MSELLAALRRRVVVPAIVVLTVTLSASAAEGEWQLIPSPSPESPVSGFADVAAISATDAWSVGSYFDPGKGRHGADRTLVEHWNGVEWSIAQAPEFGDGYSQLSSVTAISRRNVWAVGSFTKEFTQRSLVLRFNGRRWSRVGVPDPEQWDDLSDVSAVSAGDIWAVGNSYFGSFVIQWNGRAWRSVEGPIGYLTAVHAVGPDDVWVVGQQAPGQDAGSDEVIYRSLAAHWDGRTWTIVDTPNLPFHFNLLNEVHGTGPNDLWAVGSAWDSTKPHRPLILHWDGSAWSLEPPAETGATHAELFGVTSVRSDLAWAVGRADAGALIQRWNGAAWSPAPVPDAGVEEVLPAVARFPGGGAWAVGSTSVGQIRKTLTFKSAG